MDGIVVWLDRGSTAAFAVEGLAARITLGLLIVGIPTSEATAALARWLNESLTSFAEQIRGAAMSAVTVTNWALNLVVVVTFLTLLNVLGHAGTFWLYGAIAVGARVFFYLLVPETKGKSLEQIEEH
jgi:hypothetical protein